ncbi:hypothetical protein [Acetobacter okinawensis]|uniref:hypothetical protein n=1 Tax=Acetobacter okinawensis TaxID=1076594 RepID=UPI000687AC9F|nr:hypothetical protein [Acetobacter okinawensis]
MAFKMMHAFYAAVALHPWCQVWQWTMGGSMGEGRQGRRQGLGQGAKTVGVLATTEAFGSAAHAASGAP